MKAPITNRQSGDTLETYYNENNYRLPTEPIPDEVKECGSFDFKTMRIGKMENTTNECDLKQALNIEGKKVTYNGKELQK